MGSFGQVIPVVGTGFGFLGEPTRTGGGDPFIISRQVAPLAAASISFGDAVVILPDATGGTCQQYADWQANGNPTGTGLTLSTTTATNTTLTPASATLNGLSKGMLVRGSGIPAGTFITAVNWTAGTLTISKAATASATVNLQYAKLAGVAAREVKTQLGYSPAAPSGYGTGIGAYTPGSYASILVRGGISVKNLAGQGQAEGPVYMRTILNSSIPAGIVGGFEANADGVNNLLLSAIPDVLSAYYKNGVQDANGITEIVFLNRAVA